MNRLDKTPRTAPEPSADTGPEPLLDVRDYRVHLHSPRGAVRAVDDVSFTLAAGRTLAVVGESGSGKSVLCRSLLGLLPPAAIAVRTGTARFADLELTGLSEQRLRALRGRRVGMVFQDPMTALNPVMPVWRQLALPLRRHLGLGRKAARARAVELLDTVGIPDPARRARQYPVQMSGGMRQRVMIALALTCDPELLIADEPTTALDVTVQAQILRLLDRQRAERAMAMILISHDLDLVADHADDVMVVYAGRQAELGATDAVLTAPRMPYTRALLDTAPRLHSVRAERLPTIGGEPPDLTRTADGCAFESRCPRADHRCRSARPPLVVPPGSGHRVACRLPEPSAPHPAVDVVPGRAGGVDVSKASTP
ncbi:ABC transporter ATP-binding protein [Embleya sp. NPDC020886]|uniref:ABC transporter ATP-binding protein n=1 Tax=Embleya sp. NPDC020886 TaxID=3363980 RepID=UPI00379CDAEA